MIDRKALRSTLAEMDRGPCGEHDSHCRCPRCELGRSVVLALLDELDAAEDRLVVEHMLSADALSFRDAAITDAELRKKALRAERDAAIARAEANEREVRLLHGRLEAADASIQTPETRDRILHSHEIGAAEHREDDRDWIVLTAERDAGQRELERIKRDRPAELAWTERLEDERGRIAEALGHPTVDYPGRHSSRVPIDTLLADIAALRSESNTDHLLERASVAEENTVRMYAERDEARKQRDEVRAALHRLVVGATLYSQGNEDELHRDLDIARAVLAKKEADDE